MSYPQYPGGGYGERPPPSRPGTLLAGCILTWVGSVVGLLLGIGLLALSGSAELLDQLPDTTSRDDAQVALQVAGLLLLVSCLLSLLFSILAFAGKRWAAIALTVLGVLWILVSLFGIATGGGGPSIVGVVWVGASIGLVMAGSKEWFRYRSGRTVSY